MTPPREPVQAYLGLGANLGQPQASLDWAVGQLRAAPGVVDLVQSALYRSAPVNASGPWYLNAVAQVSTTLTAPDLLQLLQHLEQQAGRVRTYRNAPRTLDLDLLLYGQARIQSQHLTVPHPRMHERAFVLLPLRELAPQRVSDQMLAAVAGQAIERLA